MEWLETRRRQRGMSIRAFSRLLGVRHVTYLYALNSGRPGLAIVQGAYAAFPGDPRIPARIESSSQALRDDLWRELSLLGLSNKPAIFRRYDLEEIAVALTDLQDQIRHAPERIRNPAGLYVRLLEWSTGRKLY